MAKEEFQQNAELTPEEERTAVWLIRSFAFSYGQAGRQGTYLAWKKQQGEYDISQDIPITIPDEIKKPRYAKIIQRIFEADQEKHPDLSHDIYQVREEIEKALRTFKRMDAAFDLRQATQEQVFHGWLEKFRK
jgi:hypothetical protein